MTHQDARPDRSAVQGFENGASPLRLTPRQWRLILEDPSFLARPDNRYQRPRRLNGRPVEVVREG